VTCSTKPACCCGRIYINLKTADREEQAALSAHRGKKYRAPNGDRWTVEDTAFVRTDANGNRASVPHAQAPAIRASITRGEWDISSQPADISSPERLSSTVLTRAKTAERAREVLGGLRSSLMRRRFALSCTC
jgi:hypothetical protein